ncbi:MAG TPA: hypothetical protein VIU61_09210 [Kofleriaceae bacterium]
MKQIALGLVVTQLCSACSFVFVKGPPPNHAQLTYFDCTSSRTVPILDAVWTGLQALNLLLAASTDSAEFEDKYGLDRTVAMSLYGGLGALGAAGLYYGWTRTGQCRSAKQEWMLRAGGGDGMAPAPGTWPPPAPGPGPAPEPAPAP